jgi:hypothetical protein
MHSPPSEWNLERRAREGVRAQLERLHSQQQTVTTFSYEDAQRVSSMAQSFIMHPYWDRVAKMLSGTIQSETEQLLSGSDKQDINRASVAICRKVLQMPFIDIEQGRMVEEMYQKSKTKRGAARGGEARGGVTNV